MKVAGVTAVPLTVFWTVRWGVNTTQSRATCNVAAGCFYPAVLPDFGTQQKNMLETLMGVGLRTVPLSEKWYTVLVQKTRLLNILYTFGGEYEQGCERTIKELALDHQRTRKGWAADDLDGPGQGIDR
jgi:hypothetical protein